METMGQNCWICHDDEGVAAWAHPQSGEEYQICSFCRSSLIGVCGRCGELLVKYDRYGIVEDGTYVCSRCAEVTESSD